ncbi:MAG: T9SS type A sorting domain-containing protein [Lewinella sp.]
MSNVSAPDSLKFDFKALGDDECCFCISNEICKPIPICCDTCESIEYLLTDTIINGEDCCYSLDIYHCTDSLFTALRLSALNGVTISQQSAGPGWSMYSPALSSNTQQTWFPRPTPIHATNIPTGWSRTKVNFCLGNYDGGPLPQVLEVEWLGGNDQNVVCNDSLFFECSIPPADSTCALVTDTTWTCNPDGTYDLDLKVQVKWPQTAYQIFIDDFTSVPAGVVVTPDPLVANGVFPTNTIVTMPTLNVSNLLPGDSLCFDLALADTIIVDEYTNRCCYVEVCLVAPPCPGIGGTDCEELGLPVYDHDLLGWAAATCFSGFNNNDWQQGINNSDYVMGLIDVRGAATAPRGSNWGPPMQHYPVFRADTLGQIFGLAVDEGACIYVTASSLYGNGVSGVAGFSWGVAGPGGVYKLCPDATGAYHLSNSTSLPNGGSGLGQVTYDPVHQQIFVSNFQDGEIYRLDANTLAPLGPNYNFPGYATAAPASEPDFIALGERVWAVEYNPFDSKLYFSVWGEDQRNMGNVAARNRLYSIDIDPGTGDFVGAESYVLDLPGRDYDGTQNTNNTMPISDLAFSKAGRMLVTERTMSGEHMNQPYVNWPAHGARTFSYEWSGTQWANPRLQHVGSYNSTWNTNEHANSAGGVDFGYRNGLEGCDSMIWNMGDALQFGPQYIYGIQGHEWPGNSNQPTDPDYVVTNSLFIDLDGTINSTKKTQYGDVEIFRDPCCGEPVVADPNSCAQWEADVRAQGFTVAQIGNTGDLLITPPTVMTASDWWELDPGCDGQVTVSTSGNGTHTYPSGVRWYFCIDAYRVINGDTCHVSFAYDGLLEVDPPESCLPADDFQEVVAQGIDIDHLGTRVMINAAGLSNNCELTVDFGDGSELRVYTLEQLPIIYDYQESGRFRPEVTVIEYDDSGMVCNNSTTATANPAAFGIGLKLYPNPNQGNFNLDFNLPQAGEVNIQVFDLAGRRVLSSRQRATAGQQQLRLEAGKLPPGTYVLKMVGSGFTAAAKFQRVR